ncbi:hypothetical protein D5018_20095 [Parashewanella curva]|uniref:Uncharacterized protein n=1 Tax=Parashewanella curva TaxID=2338552 RepID=A0A3L8PRB7_9GAMM|nr:hypothetical protein [Parashewanella curva]RLV57905.1 hypothetical protein D5018_20095 [Parashewanella curva]
MSTTNIEAQLADNFLIQCFQKPIHEVFQEFSFNGNIYTLNPIHGLQHNHTVIVKMFCTKEGVPPRYYYDNTERYRLLQRDPDAYFELNFLNECLSKSFEILQPKFEQSTFINALNLEYSGVHKTHFLNQFHVTECDKQSEIAETHIHSVNQDSFNSDESQYGLQVLDIWDNDSIHGSEMILWFNNDTEKIVEIPAISTSENRYDLLPESSCYSKGLLECALQLTILPFPVAINFHPYFSLFKNYPPDKYWMEPIGFTTLLSETLNQSALEAYYIIYALPQHIKLIFAQYDAAWLHQLRTVANQELIWQNSTISLIVMFSSEFPFGEQTECAFTLKPITQGDKYLEVLSNSTWEPVLAFEAIEWIKAGNKLSPIDDAFLESCVFRKPVITNDVSSDDSDEMNLSHFC